MIFLIELPLQHNEFHMSVVSPSGRYVSFGPSGKAHEISEQGRNAFTFLFLDTVIGDTIKVSCPAREFGWPQDLAHHFSVDESAVITFLITSLNGLNCLSVWHHVGFPMEVTLKTSGQSLVDDSFWPGTDWAVLSKRLDVNSDQTTALLVTKSREIQRIRLAPEIEFLDANSTTNDLPFETFFVSQDGSRWASVHYSTDKAQLLVGQVNNPEEILRPIELEKSSPLYSLKCTLVTVSTDLNTLVIDDEIYDIGRADDQTVLGAIMTLVLPSSKQPAWRSLADVSVAFSDCGTFAYLAFGSEYDDREMERLIIDRVETAPTSLRYFESCLAVDEAFYRLTVGEGNTIRLSVSKSDQLGYCHDHDGPYLSNVANFSSLYSYRCRKLLLLGENDDQHLRLLLIPDDDRPVEVKTIPVTWFEIRELLDRKWDNHLRTKAIADSP
ncbi:MAG: hypothetical protein Q9164_007148 [Protoblastenia rupestris]